MFGYFFKNKRIKNIYHACIQKTGSQWFKKIFNDPLFSEYSNYNVFSPEKDYISTIANRKELINNSFPTETIITPLYARYDEFYLMKKPKNYRAIFVMRDPRDIFVSQFFSILYSHSYIDETMEMIKIKLQNMPIAHSFDYFIKEVYSIKDSNQPYFVALNSWLKAKNDRNIIFIKYEDFFSENQEMYFKKILKHFKIKIPQQQVTTLLNNNSFKQLTGRARGNENVHAHYRKGVPGDWQNYFTEEHKNIFKETAGQLLIDLGYEKDFNW